eukprot:7670995-Pyramimonas_sp.AAC.1
MRNICIAWVMSATYQSRDACKKGLYLAPLDEVLMEGLEEAENMLDKGLTETDRGDTALKCTMVTHHCVPDPALGVAKP